MKLSTTTIYGMFYVLPLQLSAQAHLSHKVELITEGHTEIDITERRNSIKVAEEEEAATSLKIIQLRIAMAEEEIKMNFQEASDSPQGDSSLLAKMRTIEKGLANDLFTLRSYIALMKQTVYWSAKEREKAIENWLGTTMDFESPTEHDPIAISRTEDLRKIYATYQPGFDLMKNPPAQPCHLWERKGDNDQKNAVAQTIPQLLFSSTENKLETLFIKRDFITGYGSLSLFGGGIKAFELSISISSPRAKSIYGTMKQGDFIVIKLLDGTEISLRSQANAGGGWDVNTQSFQYWNRYLIGIREERLLRSKEVDKILVRWSKVQDEYEIFELDFFRNHFSCLEND